MTSEQARTELLQLLEAHRPSVPCDPLRAFPLDRAGLLLAVDAYPDLDLGPYESRLDEFANRTGARVERGSHPEDARARLGALRAVLFEEEALHGNRVDYYDPQNSYLPRVLDRKLGIPITLAAVMLGVGRRLGWPLFPINFPAHFLVGYQDERDTLAVDPFHGGLILGQAELEERWQASTETRPPGRGRLLQPAEPGLVLLRMLRNLQLTHAHRGEFRLAALATEKLRLIDAENPVHDRDLGLLWLQAGEPSAGRAALEGYLERTGGSADAEAVQAFLREHPAPEAGS